MGQSPTKTKIQVVTAWGATQAVSKATKSHTPTSTNQQKANITQTPTPDEKTDENKLKPNPSPFNLNRKSKWSIIKSSNVIALDEKVIPLAAKYLTSFPFTIPSDTDGEACKHNRVVALEDDRIVLLDRNNDKLKLFSPDYKFLDYVDTPSRGPIGIDYANGLSVVDGSTVVVSCGGIYNCLHLYTVSGDKLTLSKTARRRDKSGDLLDITYQNDAFVCLVSHYDEYLRSIELMDLENHRTTIVKEKGLFSIYTNIVAGNYNRFYVSYTYPHKVRCYSFEGRQLWNIPAPTGEAGMALVQGQLCVMLENGNIRSASDDGHIGQDYDLQLPFTPHCICYQKHANRLIMTYCPLYERVRIFEIIETAK